MREFYHYLYLPLWLNLHHLTSVHNFSFEFRLILWLPNESKNPLALFTNWKLTNHLYLFEYFIILFPASAQLQGHPSSFQDGNHSLVTVLKMNGYHFFSQKVWKVFTFSLVFFISFLISHSNHFCSLSNFLDCSVKFFSQIFP